MAFVRGLMGPYMRPIPVGASAATMFSLIVAFVVSPWAALRLLGHYAGEGAGATHGHHEVEGWTHAPVSANDESSDSRCAAALVFFIGGVIRTLTGGGGFRAARSGSG